MVCGIPRGAHRGGTSRAMGHMGSTWQSDLWGIKGSMGQRGSTGGKGCSLLTLCMFFQLPSSYLLDPQTPGEGDAVGQCGDGCFGWGEWCGYAAIGCVCCYRVRTSLQGIHILLWGSEYGAVQDCKVPCIVIGVPALLGVSVPHCRDA